MAIYSYDTMGNTTRAEYRDDLGVTAFYSDTFYDELGRLLKTVGANGQEWNFAHDVEDNLTKTTDPQALEVNVSFDALNRVTSVVDRALATTGLTLNDADQVTQYTDPRGLATTTEFNGFGDIVTEVSPDRGTLSYTYDSRGLVASHTDGNGIVSTYEYDHGGRLLARRFASDPAQDQVYTYDTVYGGGANMAGIGMVTGFSDESGSRTIEYDPANGSLSKETIAIAGASYEVSYTYDNEGNLEYIWYPSGRRVSRTYDANNRVDSLQTTSALNNVKLILDQITYLPNGPATSLLFHDGPFTQTREFDGSYNLTRLLDTDGFTTLRDVSFGYDSRDDLITITDTVTPAQNEVLTYTGRQRLDTATGAYGDFDYEYDASGNRTYMSPDAANSSPGGNNNPYDYHYPTDSNKLEKIGRNGPNGRQFQYDAAGNIVYDKRYGDVQNYTYNAANRMATMAIQSTVQAEYKYNALGQQAIRTLTQQAKNIHSVFDAEGNRIAEYDYDSLTGISILLAEYIWLNGELIAVVDGVTGIVYDVRSDHIGRPVFATTAFGIKVWEATYKPFGEVDVATGTPVNLRFPGQWYSSESALHQNWMRDYDPSTGRYLQPDPLGLVDGASVYGYVDGNPVSRIDPMGLMCNSKGCWLTGTERDFAISGNYRNYYRKACAGGDSYACAAGKVANNNGLSANFTNWRLRRSLRKNGASDAECDSKMEGIRMALAMAHALLLSRGSEKHPIVLTADQISIFHNRIFDHYGAGPVFGGDIPGSNLVFQWCTKPSCKP